MLNKPRPSEAERRTGKHIFFLGGVGKDYKDETDLTFQDENNELSFVILRKHEKK